MEGDLKRNEAVSPMAGKTPSQEMLVDVTRLEREYFEHLPDVEDPTQLVSFGTSGLEVVSHVPGQNASPWLIKLLSELRRER